MVKRKLITMMLFLTLLNTLGQKARTLWKNGNPRKMNVMKENEKRIWNGNGTKASLSLSNIRVLNIAFDYNAKPDKFYFETEVRGG